MSVVENKNVLPLSIVSKPLIRTGRSILGMKKTPRTSPFTTLMSAEMIPRKMFQKKKKKLRLYHPFLVTTIVNGVGFASSN